MALFLSSCRTPLFLELCVSLRKSVSALSLCLSVYLPISLSPSVDLFVRLFICMYSPFSLSAFLSQFCRPVYASVCLSLSLPTFLSPFCRLTVYPSIRRPVCLFVCHRRIFVCSDLVRIFAPVLVSALISPCLYLPLLLSTPLSPLQCCCWLCSTWNNKIVLTFANAVVASDGHGASHPFAFPRLADQPTEASFALRPLRRSGRHPAAAIPPIASKQQRATPRRLSGSLYHSTISSSLLLLLL